MNKTAIALVTLAFFVGEGVGVTRSNRYARKAFKKQQEILDIANMKVTTLNGFIHDVSTGTPTAEAMSKFEAAKEFIEILEEAL